MKKLLLASAAIALTAGAASAQVTLSGDARFGVHYNSSLDARDFDNNFRETRGDASKLRIEKRMRVNIDARTETDTGIAFGGRIRILNEEYNHANGGGSSTAAQARLYAQSGGLTIAVGNILGALEVMPGSYAASVGMTGLSWAGLIINTDRAYGTNVRSDYFTWDGYSSGGSARGDGVELIYAAGDFAFHLSHTSGDLDGSTVNPTVPGSAKTESRTAAWASYNWTGWTFALGVQDGDFADDRNDMIVFTAGGNIGDFGVGIGLARHGSGDNKVNKVALNGSYNFGATTVTGYVSYQDEDDFTLAGGGLVDSKTAYGIGASYNLGGGARLIGGIERTTRKNTRA
ncbi:MAG: porin, partial [Gemmobacter sp.]